MEAFIIITILIFAITLSTIIMLGALEDRAIEKIKTDTAKIMNTIRYTLMIPVAILVSAFTGVFLYTSFLESSLFPPLDWIWWTIGGIIIGATYIFISFFLAPRITNQVKQAIIGIGLIIGVLSALGGLVYNNLQVIFTAVCFALFVLVCAFKSIDEIEEYISRKIDLY